MKNTHMWVCTWLRNAYSRILFAPSAYSDVLKHATIETFISHVRQDTSVHCAQLSNAHALYHYKNGLIQSAIHCAKYRNRKDVCVLFGELLWHAFGEELSYQHILHGLPWTVVPIPISKSHRRKRGYNQTEYIARGFLKHADPQVFTLSADALHMASSHKNQTHALRKKERIQNSIGAFTITHPELIRSKNILLIDDVITTGATLSEASRLLRAKGARRVYCLAIAH